MNETPSSVLRRAAAQARTDAMTVTGQTRSIGLAYARGLEHDADRADRGETGHLPPALASARFYLETEA